MKALPPTINSAVPALCASAPATPRLSFAAGKRLSDPVGLRVQPRESFLAGELVLVEVLANPKAKPTRLADLSVASLSAGDRVVCVLGQNASFKIDLVDVPTRADVEWVLINRGGLVGQPIQSSPESIRVRYLGNLMQNNKPVRLENRLPPLVAGRDRPILVVVGSETNSGKTTTVRTIVAGLRARGYRVGACKLTGICGDDPLEYGADQVVDFSDAGLASTIENQAQAVDAAGRCVALLQQHNDVVVVEFGSGLASSHPILPILSTLPAQSTRIVVCTLDVVGALGALLLLGSIGRIPSLFAGVATNSALARAVIQEKTGVAAASFTEDLASMLLLGGITHAKEQC